MVNAFTVSLVSWHDGGPLLRGVREAVFIREQGVPAELEWDEFDEHCRHALALSLQGEAIGSGRLLPNGHIGRIAVLPNWRKKKVGTAIMEALLAEARGRHFKQVDVDAQVQAMAFYHGFGFREEGLSFMDAGIPHIRMTKSLLAD